MDNATSQQPAPIGPGHSPEEAPGPALSARPRTWKRRLRRLIGQLALCYLGVMLLMLLLENWLLYPATSAARHWQPKPDERIQDVELQSADGTPLHAWWLPCDGAAGALLY